MNRFIPNQHSHNEIWHITVEQVLGLSIQLIQQQSVD